MKINLKSLYRWVPSLYMMEGLPYGLVAAVSPVFYKSFNMSNSKIALYTSLFMAPWFLKPLLAPALENAASKQQIILMMQFLIAGLFLLLALTVNSSHFMLFTGVIFFSIALSSSVHDTNCDGLYVVKLNSKEQTYFIGIRTLFYQLGRLITQSGVIFMVGFLLLYFHKPQAWQMALVILCFYFLIFAIYHKKILPKEAVKSQLETHSTFDSFKNVAQEFLQLKNLTMVIAFTLLYNFPEAQLVKIFPLYLLDTVQHGGLEISIKSLGLIYGGLGSIMMLLGILLASNLIAKVGFNKLFIPLTATTAISNLGYVFFTQYHLHSIALITVIIAITQFSFGLSNGVYMVFLLNTFTKGRYPMSLYALGTSLMGLGIIFSSAVSGYMQAWLGYDDFFIWIVISGLLVIGISLIAQFKRMPQGEYSNEAY
jgi:PAT family beta-lactamase induction signal transducer AmpG